MNNALTKKKVYMIAETIDLQSILNEARSIFAEIKLVSGSLKGEILWDDEISPLSYDYDISIEHIFRFVKLNNNKIIKISVTSSDAFFPIDRNIIIYVPTKYDLFTIREKYERFGNNLELE